MAYRTTYCLLIILLLCGAARQPAYAANGPAALPVRAWVNCSIGTATSLCNTMQGFGVSIDARHVLTVAHIVTSGGGFFTNKIQVSVRGRWCTASLRKKDTKLDLAVLSLSDDCALDVSYPPTAWDVAQPFSVGGGTTGAPYVSCPVQPGWICIDHVGYMGESGTPIVQNDKLVGVVVGWLGPATKPSSTTVVTGGALMLDFITRSLPAQQTAAR